MLMLLISLLVGTGVSFFPWNWEYRYIYTRLSARDVTCDTCYSWTCLMGDRWALDVTVELDYCWYNSRVLSRIFYRQPIKHKRWRKASGSVCPGNFWNFVGGRRCGFTHFRGRVLNWIKHLMNLSCFFKSITLDEACVFWINKTYKLAHKRKCYYQMTDIYM